MSSDVDYSDRQHVILVSVSCYIHYVSVDERVKATRVQLDHVARSGMCGGQGYLSAP